MSAPDAFPLVCRLLPPEAEAAWRLDDGFLPALLASQYKFVKGRTSFLLFFGREIWERDDEANVNRHFFTILAQLRPDDFLTMEAREVSSWSKDLGLIVHWYYGHEERTPRAGERIPLYP